MGFTIISSSKCFTVLLLVFGLCSTSLQQNHMMHMIPTEISRSDGCHELDFGGWSLSWTWRGNEIIWCMMGAAATGKTNCSRFKGTIPHSCRTTPTIVDLLPSTPLNQQTPRCCKGGVLSSMVQNPAFSVAAFQITVGKAGTNNQTVRLPKNFTIGAPAGPRYSCRSAKIVRPTYFITPNLRRLTKVTCNITCTISHFLVQNTLTCCVSLSSVYNNTTVPCKTCSCGCQDNTSKCRAEFVCSCFQLRPDELYAATGAILELGHPGQNIDKLTKIFRFNHKSLTLYNGINDTAMLWGIKFYNNILMQAGPLGSVESELMFQKDDGANSSSAKTVAFPRMIYFNGEYCDMPPPDTYPVLPN